MLKKTVIALLALSMTTILSANPSSEKNLKNPHPPTTQKSHVKRRGMHSIFLIQRGLPHYSRILMKLWSDTDLHLTPTQKKRLQTIRKETMQAVLSLAPQIKKLRKEIVQGSKKGVDPEKLATQVDTLAALKAKATKIQLHCIAQTKKVLSADQIKLIHQKIRRHRKKKTGGK